MNKLEEILKDIFNPKVILDSSSITVIKKSLYEIILEEENNKDKINTLKELKLSGFNKIYFAVKFDKLSFLHGRKDSKSESIEDSLLLAKNIRKSCDYIIWANFQGQKIILLVELKSGHNDFVLEKFKSSRSFIKYLNSIMDEYYNFKSCQEYKLISLLINDKEGEMLSKVNGYYRKGLKSRKKKGEQNIKKYYLTRDFEKILNGN